MRFRSEVEEMNPASSWLQRMFPELTRFPNQENRNDAWRRAGQSVHWSGSLLCGFLLLLILSPILKLCAHAGTWLARNGELLAIGIAMFVAWYLAPFLLLWIFRGRLRQYLWRELLKHHVPTCLKCGYDLRGLISPRCPECGVSFDERLLGGKTNAIEKVTEGD